MFPSQLPQSLTSEDFPHWPVTMKIGINLDTDFRNKTGTTPCWLGASAAAELNGLTWSNDAITVSAQLSRYSKAVGNWCFIPLCQRRLHVARKGGEETHTVAWVKLADCNGGVPVSPQPPFADTHLHSAHLTWIHEAPLQLMDLAPPWSHDSLLSLSMLLVSALVQSEHTTPRRWDNGSLCLGSWKGNSFFLTMLGCWRKTILVFSSHLWPQERNKKMPTKDRRRTWFWETAPINQFLQTAHLENWSVLKESRKMMRAATPTAWTHLLTRMKLMEHGCGQQSWPLLATWLNAAIFWLI